MRKTSTPEQIFAKLGDVWQKARGAREMPARADINPAQAGAALHYAALLDVVPGQPLDFRYRLLGQHMIEAYGLNVTGAKHTEQFAPKPHRPVYEALARCVETRAPQEAATINFRNHNGTPCRVRVQAWPLSDDGTSVTGLLAACIFVPEESSLS
jgi:hypothetical protein